MATTAEEVEHLTLDLWTIVDSMLRQVSSNNLTQGFLRLMLPSFRTPTPRTESDDILCAKCK